MAEERRCAGCERVIEWCSFCDEEDCDVARCYRCVGIALVEITTQPHPHGG